MVQWLVQTCRRRWHWQNTVYDVVTVSLGSQLKSYVRTKTGIIDASGSFENKCLWNQRAQPGQWIHLPHEYLNLILKEKINQHVFLYIYIRAF